MAGHAGIEPTPSVSKTEMISISPMADGTLPLIRTGRTSPFERDDFTNLSSRAVFGATSRNRTWFNGSSDRRYDHIS